jgi:hypothetical protein
MKQIERQQDATPLSDVQNSDTTTVPHWMWHLQVTFCSSSAPCWCRHRLHTENQLLNGGKVNMAGNGSDLVAQCIQHSVTNSTTCASKDVRCTAGVIITHDELVEFFRSIPGFLYTGYGYKRDIHAAQSCMHNALCIANLPTCRTSHSVAGLSTA